MELPWSWRGSEACSGEWALARRVGRQAHSSITSEQERITAQRDLFVALAMRLKLIYRRRDLGFQGPSQRALFRPRTTVTTHGQHVSPQFSWESFFLHRCSVEPSFTSLRIAMSECSTREPLFHVT